MIEYKFIKVSTKRSIFFQRLSPSSFSSLALPFPRPQLPRAWNRLYDKGEYHVNSETSKRNSETAKHLFFSTFFWITETRKNNTFQYQRTLRKRHSWGFFLTVNLHEVNSIFLLYIAYKTHQNSFHSLVPYKVFDHWVTELRNNLKRPLRTVPKKNGNVPFRGGGGGVILQPRNKQTLRNCI